MKKKIIAVVVVLLFLLTCYAAYSWSLIGSCPDKLWLHRCNSLEKMHEKHEIYPNIEVDLVYRGSGVFDVTHDADTTFKLKINPYFKEIAKSKGHMWLDIKNVNMDNIDSLYHDMDSLCECYNVDEDQLIIEGGDYNALETFTDSGYYTSYYVPYDKPSRLSDEEIDSCMNELNKIADTDKVCALSFPGWWYDEIKENVDDDIDLLTWKHRTTQFEFMLLPEHDEMLDDEHLKVILLKSKGNYHR